MALSIHDIDNDAWTQITSAGESGSCWLSEDEDYNVGSVDVRIFHSDSGAPDEEDLEHAKKVYTPQGNDDVLIISADNINDIYYARCNDLGSEAKLVVDVN